MEYKGLSEAEAAAILKSDGPNAVAIKQPGLLRKLFKWVASPINVMLLVAVGLSYLTQRLFDAGFIGTLIILNTFLSALNGKRADKAVASLQNKLGVAVKVMRGGDWKQLPADQLVKGDVIKLGVGDIVPADCEILEGQNITANESVITGESMPKTKAAKDSLLSGSYISTGSAIAQVTATGPRTRYGKALVLVETASKRSLLEEEMLRITYLLSSASLAAIVVLTLSLLASGQPLVEVLRIDLSLAIAGIPVSMATVMTIIMGIGIAELSKKQVVVRRLAALENLANTNLLLTDKTGTLTENRISVASLMPSAKDKELDLLALARAAAGDPDKSPIDKAVYDEAKRQDVPIGWTVLQHTPADSQRKRNTAIIQQHSAKLTVSSGAPQVIFELCKMSPSERKGWDRRVDALAANGFRVLAIASAKGEHEKAMAMAGLVCLADPARPDAAETINSLHHEGIEVRMITGDNLAIAQQVSQAVGIKGEIIGADNLHKNRLPDLTKWWKHYAGFAEIFPDDKYRLTELSKKDNVVAVTGDGVNDLPALGVADVGIAVKNAVDALRQSADLVILSDGIKVLQTAIIEARQIFERLYGYSVYRISESFRLIVTIAILGLIVHSYPITPLQLILLAFLNDLPIITLAYNRVQVTHRPANSRSTHKLMRGLLHGSVGILSSLLLYTVMSQVWHLPLASIQTAFFLKLTVSGHMLIYVAHTDKRWFRYLPSMRVIAATSTTQLLATLAAGAGILMNGIPLWLIGVIWLWSFMFMQVSDIVKYLVPQK